MRRIYSYTLILSFLIIIFLGGILTIFKNEANISKTENRVLAPKPKATKEKLLEGTWFNELDAYFRDQFIGRNNWIKTSSKINMLLQKKKYIDVVLGKGGYLLSFNGFQYKEDKEKLISDVNYSVSEMKALDDYIKSNGGTFIFAGVPNQSYYHADKYLNYFESMKGFYIEQDDLFFKGLNDNGIHAINMMDTFKNEKEELYFKTDHHYNFRGAYLTYSHIINELIQDKVNISNPYTLEELGLEKINKPFHGSWNAKVSWLFKTDDYIEIPHPKFQMPKYKKIVNGKEDNRLFYYNEKDATTSYAVYMNGDNAEVKITTARNELPKALIFGDSFTNGIEPLLSLHFNETRILDLRYYKQKSLYSYIEEYKPDVVIFVLSSAVYTFPGGNNDFKGVEINKK